MKSATWNRALRSALLTVVMAIGLLLMQMAQAQTFNVIHNFTGEQDGANPQAGLTIDRAGNLYGTTADGGAGYGTVFQLKHHGPTWVVNPLYSFDGMDGGLHQAEWSSARTAASMARPHPGGHGAQFST